MGIQRVIVTVMEKITIPTYNDDFGITLLIKYLFYSGVDVIPALW
jgi:hypothetical protein